MLASPLKGSKKSGPHDFDQKRVLTLQLKDFLAFIAGQIIF